MSEEAWRQFMSEAPCKQSNGHSLLYMHPLFEEDKAHLLSCMACHSLT